MNYSKDEKIKKIAEHYNKIPKVNKEIRIFSKIINIKNMNNFIKSLLIKSYVHSSSVVLDLGCGKGGDLNKYRIANIKEYIGIDVAEKSIEEAKIRYKQGKYPFRSEFYCLDAYNTQIEYKWEVDVVSSQFSFHYAFSSLESLRIAINNVSSQLKYNGYFIITVPDADTILRRYKRYGNGFGNEYYRITFVEEKIGDQHCGIEYEFKLEGAINNCIEYIVDQELLVSECKRYGMVLVESTPFLEYINKNIKSNIELYKKMVPENLKFEEVKVIELYRVVVFKKVIGD